MLRIGKRRPAGAHGYGLGFTSDGDLEEASRELRALGFPTSAPTRADAGERAWRAVQVARAAARPVPRPDQREAARRGRPHHSGAAGVLAKIPAVARAATRNAGGSMVVVTEYEFDAAAWRAGQAAARGPRGPRKHRRPPHRLAARAGRRGHALRFSDDEPAGVTRIVLAGEREGFAVGDVTVEFRSR